MVGDRVMGMRLAAVACMGVLLLAQGCSGTKKGGWFGGGGGGDLSEQPLAGEGSLAQFEQSGEVVPGAGPLEDVHFQFDSVDLDPQAMTSVQRNAAWLASNPAARVEIEGHCDERGTSEYNLALGARRARAVRDALVAQGISSDRLSTVSYGEELPLCKESTDSCWEKNRRAHFVQLGR
jgi:peptidoglycan-associated lipoprotein